GRQSPRFVNDENAVHRCSLLSWTWLALRSTRAAGIYWRPAPRWGPPIRARTMIPIRDDQPRFSTPYMTYGLIGLNLLIYFFESSLDPESFKPFLFQFGMIPSPVPALLSGSSRLSPVAVFLPAFTSMFLHGSWMHVI